MRIIKLTVFLSCSPYGFLCLSFEYREDGLRTQKTVNGVTTEYFYDGSLLIAEQTGDTIVMYYYDESGSPIAMQYRDATKGNDVWDKYIFEKNLQGDVVAIYSTSGTKLVSYTYDAWGNVSISYHNGGASTSATYNRLTYRGYYYDTDLQLYYLQSRYYDAKVGRFINADNTEFLGANGDLNSYNLYAYCSNNPVMYQDPSGHIIWSAIILSGLVGMAIGAATSIIDQLWNNGDDWSQIHWGEVIVDTVAGAINGALAASSITTGGAIAVGALLGGGASVAKDLLFHSGNINWDNALFNAVIGGASGIIAGAGADAITGGRQVTKYHLGREILKRTISNGSTHAIARQTNALLVHGKELAISAFRYFAGNASAFFGTNLYPGR